MRSLPLALLLVACNGPSGDDTADTNDTNDVPDGARTLDNCGGTVDADVPDFYAKYFHCVDISMDGDSVVIETEDLPPHQSYYYGEGDPNYAEFDYDRGNQYSPNPNELGAQNLGFTIPLNPTSKGLTISDDMVDTMMGTDDDEFGGGAVGVALDSVALFNDQAAPGDDINDEKYTFDSYEGHPAGTTYHYHTETAGPLEVLEYIGLTTATAPGSADVELYGIMCDGTVVLGCTELDGSAPSSGDFDAQNGHTHDITDGDVTLTGRYHTHVCTGTFTDHLFMPEIQYYDSCERDGAGPP